MQRPGWSQLEKELRSGGVERVVVWRMDRLGRTAAGLTALFEELRNRKVPLISIRDGFDLFTPAGHMMATVLASVAQYETEVRSERQAAGIAAARASGKRWGGRVAGSPYKATDEVVRQVLRMASEGVGKAEIARVTGLSRQTIYRIIASEERPKSRPAAR